MTQKPSFAPLFAGWEETLIDSCLEGVQGHVLPDNATPPRCAVATVGDFSFFAGDETADGAAELVRALPTLHHNGFVLAVPQNEGWASRIAQIFPDALRLERYAFYKDADAFDEARLRAFVQALPQGYALRRIDAELYAEAKAQYWCRDFVSQYKSAEDYLSRSLGVAAIFEGKMVAGASGYTCYSGGIEIEIQTLPEHRRKGLALACASQLILDCRARGLYASWDASNLDSVALAQKLGYRLRGAYTTLLLKFPAA